MKKTWIYAGLLMCCGCFGQPNSSSALAPSATPQSSDRCPDQPKGALENKNVKPVEFANQSASVSGQLRSGESLGYKFQGEAGKTLTFQTKEDICIWVYTPTNQILTDFKLPETGQYVIQVAAKQGNLTFSLQMGLGDPQQTVSTQTPPNPNPPEKATQTFAKSDFPKSACGDSRPTSPSAYPLTFYPVNLPNTVSNLNRVRSQFCSDAYIKKSKDTGERIIQVASFTNQQNAKAFSELVGSEINGAIVGPPTILHRPADE